MRNFKLFFFLSLLINIVFGIIIFKDKFYKYFDNYKEKSNNVYFLNRDELFKVFPKSKNSIIFIGNSLTQNFELAELFQNLSIKNRGIIGDYTSTLFNRLEPIIEEKPKKIFIEIGINDLGINLPNDSLVNNYLKIIDKLQSKTPNSKIYIQSIFPVKNDSQYLKSITNPEVNKNVVLVNKELKSICEKKNLTYIDIYSSFELEGQMNPKYSIDGVHLNGAGYLLWRDKLKSFVEN
ncbi:MAG: GDSL-type esterase/lipase family protein [Flavobacterium sp.]